MLVDGASVCDVAETLHLSTDTVRRYKAIVANGGLDALSKMSVGGRSSILDEEALAWIESALSGSARESVFPVMPGQMHGYVSLSAGDLGFTTPASMFGRLQQTLVWAAGFRNQTGEQSREPGHRV
ncbi:hypothetical protein AAGS40_26915 (plasmid) [Paraburkholderia sp. PREW-6R]|uniref:hypothetical protein n=1 Tax=Paraburkholderia sp. PREW-6R TaxID=3141544 RepID=UPI0031F49697